MESQSKWWVEVVWSVIYILGLALIIAPGFLLTILFNNPAIGCWFLIYCFLASVSPLNKWWRTYTVKKSLGQK